MVHILLTTVIIYYIFLISFGRIKKFLSFKFIIKGEVEGSNLKLKEPYVRSLSLRNRDNKDNNFIYF